MMHGSADGKRVIAPPSTSDETASRDLLEGGPSSNHKFTSTSNKIQKRSKHNVARRFLDARKDKDDLTQLKDEIERAINRLNVSNLPFVSAVTHI